MLKVIQFGRVNLKVNSTVKNAAVTLIVKLNVANIVLVQNVLLMNKKKSVKALNLIVGYNWIKLHNLL